MVQKVAQMAPNYQIWQQCSQVFAIELVFALPSAMDIANQCCQKICKRPKNKKNKTSNDFIAGNGRSLFSTVEAGTVVCSRWVH